VISQSAAKAFSRHFWYLTEELVPLALFSDKLSIQDKQSIMETLLSCKKTEKCKIFENRTGSTYGKPSFPALTDCSHSLLLLAGPDSWGFFKVLKMDVSFLEMPVDQWMNEPSYQMAIKTVKNLRVVNDSAERGVKLGSDFLSAAKIEERYQNVLQVWRPSNLYNIFGKFDNESV
jgi:hypothetical protein